MPQVISANPFRCRMWDLHDRFEYLVTEESCRTELDSFLKHGQLVAALGRSIRNDPDYDIELIFGARRLFIARHLNVRLTVELREITDREAIVAADIENRQRQDVSPYERGMFFTRCLRAGHFKSQESLAAELNISQSQVSRLLKLARLPTIVVNAFENPLEIREGWGPDLAAAVDDPQRRKRTIARARTLVDIVPRPSAIEVYQQLACAGAGDLKSRARTRDEVVTDVDGSPLFRIRRQVKSVALLLPMEKISTETLDCVRDAVRGVLKQKPLAGTSKRPRPAVSPSVVYAAAARC